MKIKKIQLEDIFAFTLVSSIVFVGILSGEKAGLLLFAISTFAILGVLFFRRKIKIERIPNIIRLYFFLCIMALLSSFYAINMQYSLDVLWKIFSVLFIMFFIHIYTQNSNNVFKLMYLFLFNTLILVIYNIINYQPSIFRELPYGGVNPVALLMFLSITITIFLYHTNKKKIILLLIPLYLYLLFLTQSQKSILSIAIELILYTVLNLYFLNIKSSIKYFFLSVLLVFIGYYFLLEFEILEGSANRTFATIKALTSGGHVEGAAGGAVGEGLRAVVKEYGWSYFAESPFWGYGINNFRELYGRETGFYTYTHYTPLELILGMGFLALPIYYGIYYLLLRDYFKSLKKHRISTYSFVISSIIATIIVGLYMQTYFDAAIHFYLMLLYVFNKFKVKELNYHALKVHGFNN